MQISSQAQQIKELIKKSDRVMLLTQPNARSETVYNLLGWEHQLEYGDRRIDVFVPGLKKEKLISLPGVKRIKTQMPLQCTTIKVGLGDSGLRKLSYEVVGNDLLLHLEPNQGIILGNQVEVSASQLDYDLIITLDMQNAEVVPGWSSNWVRELGPGHSVVNLDIDQQNTQFGMLNYIDPSKSRITHLSCDLIKQMGWSLRPEAATMFLLGLRVATNNFSGDVSPEDLERSAQLMRSGAEFTRINDRDKDDRGEIVDGD